MKLGDVVRLKSGGPAMTVSKRSLSPPDTVECVWFRDNELRTAEFAEVSLTTAAERFCRGAESAAKCPLMVAEAADESAGTP